MFAFVGLDNKPITEFVQMRTETCPEAKEDWERIVWSNKMWNIVLYTCVSAENVKPYKCGGACWAWRNKSPTWISIRNTFLSLKFNCTENHPLTAPFFFTIDLDSSFIIIQISFNKFCAVLRCQISLLELKKAESPTNTGNHPTGSISQEKKATRVTYHQRVPRWRMSGKLPLLPPTCLNPLVLDLDIYSLSFHLCKMWIFYEPRSVTLGNTRHFVGE